MEMIAFCLKNVDFPPILGLAVRDIIYAVYPVITHNRLPPSSVPPPTKQSLPTNIWPRSQSPVSTMGCRPPMTRCAVPTLRTGLVHFCSFASVAKAVATSSSSKTRALRRSNSRLCITSRRSLVKHRDSSTRIWSFVWSIRVPRYVQSYWISGV
jgi:hypothetical protein